MVAACDFASEDIIIDISYIFDAFLSEQDSRTLLSGGFFAHFWYFCAPNINILADRTKSVEFWTNVITADGSIFAEYLRSVKNTKVQLVSV